MKMSGKAGTRDTQHSQPWFFPIRNLIIGAAVSVGGFGATALSAQSRFQKPISRPVPSGPFPDGWGVSPDSSSGSGGDFSIIGFLIVLAIVYAALWLCFKIIGKATDESDRLATVLGIFFLLIGSVAAAVAAYNSRKGEVLETVFGAVLAAFLVSVIPVSILICLPYLGIVYLKERAALRRDRKKRRMTP
jgi:uncharacterized membrane protein YbhN (UPF0104 family)